MKFQELLEKIRFSYTNALPFVVYNKPNTNKIIGYFQKNDKLNFLDSFSDSGFIFAPFDDKQQTILIPEFDSSKFTVEFSSEPNQKDKVSIESQETGKQAHLDLVTRGIDFIKSGKAKKVVLSRKEDIILGDFSVASVFKKLLLNYPLAMTYVWYHPKVGLWMGATPETLVSVKKNVFKTMALAGTQPFADSLNVMWQQKELDEQQFVTDYINKQLEEKVNELTFSHPYTVKAGNLLHLRTDISGIIKNKEDLKFLVENLHPTPAVCGLPRETAKQFILKCENYDREFYTGYLGELNLNNSSNLFVNLRCMKIKNTVASVFVGGGITKDSIVENEWQETVEKAKVMESCLI